MKHIENEEMLKELLIEILMNTDEYITSTRILKNNPHFKNSANIRHIVNCLRREGTPIISSSDGYKYTMNKEEVMTYMFSLRNRIKEMRIAYEGLYDFCEQNNITYNTDISNYK